MNLGIVTNSTCDLPQALVEQHELEVVPAILIIEGKNTRMELVFLAKSSINACPISKRIRQPPRLRLVNSRHVLSKIIRKRL